MSDEDRKCISIWLKPRHQKMLESMPEVNLSEIARRSVEELFEGRNDREYALVSIEQDLAELELRWEVHLGLKTKCNVTVTEEGFRIVMNPVKRYSDAPDPTPRAPAAPVAVDSDEEFFDELDDWEDAE